MRINWKVRLNNPNWWFCAVGSIVMPVIAYFGLNFESFTTWAIVWDTFIVSVSNPYVVMMCLFSLYNAIVDPTTAGVSDSRQALNYIKPNSEKKYDK